MNFLELQSKIKRRRKDEKERQKYWETHETWEGYDFYHVNYQENPDFYELVYKKALRVANQVVRHYEELGEYSSTDKPTLSWKDRSR